MSRLSWWRTGPAAEKLAELKAKVVELNPKYVAVFLSNILDVNDFFVTFGPTHVWFLWTCMGINAKASLLDIRLSNYTQARYW
jgi:hypothetical protein